MLALYLTVSLSWPSALPTLCSTHCNPVNAILPNSSTLDGYTLRQNWSANICRSCTIMSAWTPLGVVV